MTPQLSLARGLIILQICRPCVLKRTLHQHGIPDLNLAILLLDSYLHLSGILLSESIYCVRIIHAEVHTNLAIFCSSTFSWLPLLRRLRFLSFVLFAVNAFYFSFKLLQSHLLLQNTESPFQSFWESMPMLIFLYLTVQFYFYQFVMVI